MEAYTWATGRRKSSTAQVRIRKGSGKVMVNKRDFDNYFPVEQMRGYIQQPLQITDYIDGFDVMITVKGGGIVGQAGAIRHGLARALVKVDESTKDVLKESGMLTRDARVKERKKAGRPGARKRFQFSKR